MTQIKPIAMKCSEEQFNAIKHKVSNFNTEECYSWQPHDYLVTNFNGNLGKIGNVRADMKDRYNRIVFEEWNEQTFLEYCGIATEKRRMVTTVDIGAKVVRGRDWEWYEQDKDSVHGVIISESSHGWVQVKWISKDGNTLRSNGYRIGAENCYDLYYYEEETIKQETMKKYTNYKIAATELLKIHAVACSTWKSKIIEYFDRLDSEQNVEFTEGEINAMFDAASSGQIPVLEGVFGKPQLFCPYKQGEIVWMWDYGDHRLKLGHFDEPSGRRYRCGGATWDNVAPFNNGQLPDGWKEKFGI